MKNNERKEIAEMEKPVLNSYQKKSAALLAKTFEENVKEPVDHRTVLACARLAIAKAVDPKTRWRTYGAGTDAPLCPFGCYDYIGADYYNKGEMMLAEAIEECLKSSFQAWDREHALGRV